MSAKNNHEIVYLNQYGRPVMRVTDVIKTLAKDQIAVWANMLGFKHIDYKKELDRTSRVGTMLHGVLEQYMNPKTLAVIDYDNYSVYGFQSRLEATHVIKSFFKWYESLTVPYMVVFTEKTIIGDYVGGTIDCGIRGFNDPEKVILVDYKTSSRFYMTHFLQLAGYVSLYEEVVGPDTIEGIMVVLANKKTGAKAQARFIPRDKLEVFIMCFQHLYNTAITTKLLNDSWTLLTNDVE